MRRRPLTQGNADGGTRDNHPVHAVTELTDLIGDLCRYATLFHLAGRASWADTLIEQCGDLLAHRARLLAASCDGSETSDPTSPTNATPNCRDTKCTN